MSSGSSKIFLTLSALAALGGTLAALGGSAAAQPNPLVVYHGYVTNARNEPVSGAFAVTFKLFDAATSGNEVWSETQNVMVDAGNLITSLGGQTRFTPALFADRVLYLSLKVGSEEMPVRQPVGSVPLALHADDAKGIAGLPVVSTGCTAGQVLTFSATGWTCASAGATYTGGPGVQVAGTVISLPTSCASGQLLKWNGTTWNCAGDEGGVSYTAGAGLSLVGNSFSLLATCQQGQVLKWNGTTWACAGDDNAGRTYVAGDGLSLNEANGTFSLKGTCAEGQILKRIGGAWTCAADSDTLFTAAAGGGLSLSSGAFGLVSCSPGQVLKSTGAGWACNTDIDTDTQYDVVANAGLAKTGNNFGLISCGSGQVLKFNSGQWACGDDVVGTPGTTYSAGAGLALNGTQFSVMPCASPDEYLRWTGTSWACASDWIGDIIQPEYGGLGVDISDATTGTLLYKSATGWAMLAAASDGRVLKLVGGVPSWEVDAAGSGTVTSITAGTGLSGGTITTSGTIAVNFAGAGSAVTAARSDHTHATGDIVSGTLAIARGGTGATTATGALSSLGAAGRGANSDITSLSGLTTPLSVGQGGTGSATQNFIDLTTNQTIAGTKTFSSTISGSVSGSAGSFTGSLAGDVQGTQGATTVAALQGRAVASTAPVANQHLRFNGTSWTPAAVALATDVSGVLAVASGGTGSATQNFIDLTTNQTIAGTKTFSSTISGNVSGSAASFTGALGGDVQGPQGATTVAALQGRAVVSTAPANNQHLRFNGTAWAPGLVALATDVSGLLSVAQGGTGASSAATARINLGAAASGANSDITSLSGLTTLSITNPASTSGATGVTGTASSSTGTTRGVQGTVASNSDFTAGVLGFHSATSGGGKGVYGQTESTTGSGVFGVAASSTGVNFGVYGQTNSASGYGLYTPNNAFVGGRLDCTGCVSSAGLKPTVINLHQAPGSLTVTTNPAASSTKTCQTSAYTPTTSQMAVIIGGLSWTVATQESASVALLYSTDNGATWLAVSTTHFGDTNPAGGWASATLSRTLNLTANTSYVFAVAGWSLTGATFTTSNQRCHITVEFVGR